MDWLNYHHLLYFWTVAREGSIAKASQQLHLAQPTISGQIRMLEESLGERLFARAGRNLVLTDRGRLVFDYANEIFSLGRELMDTLRDRPTGRPLRVQVGLADAVSKLVAYRLLDPALKLEQPVHIICREGRPEDLVADLARHNLDMVLTDAPISPGLKIKAFNHLLGDSGLTVFGTAALAKAHRRTFPSSLDGAPVLLPTAATLVRRSLDQWFAQIHVRPRIVAEFDDGALAHTFGQAGVGLFVGPTVTEAEVRRQFGVSVVGRISEVRERVYAISVERRLKHPAVVAISDAAHTLLGQHTS